MNEPISNNAVVRRREAGGRAGWKGYSEKAREDTRPYRSPWPGLVLVTAVLVVAGCGKHEAGPAAVRTELPAAKVRTQVVEVKPRMATEEVVGTLRARDRATIAAKLSGRIEELPLALGQKVKAGDLVARIDAAEIKARVQQAEAALEQAQRDWKRVSKLVEQQAATRAEADAVESRWGIAKAALAEAQATMQNATVTAPFDGVVTRKWAQTGDFAQPGKPLVDIESPAHLQVEADIPEALLASIKPSAELMVHVGQERLKGTVREIAPAGDPVSRTFRVKLDLPGESGLFPGQFARLVVPLGQSESLRVPASAVVQRGQLEIAFVISDQRAQLHLIKTGSKVGDEFEVLSGLDSGDVVVTEGTSQLKDGQPVDVQ